MRLVTSRHRLVLLVLVCLVSTTSADDVTHHQSNLRSVTSRDTWNPGKWLLSDPESTFDPEVDNNELLESKLKNQKMEKMLAQLRLQMSELEVNVTTTRGTNLDQLTSCELRRLEEENARLKQQAAAQEALNSAALEVEKLKLKHVQETFSLMVQKQAAIDETHRYKRQVEELNIALERVKGELRGEIITQSESVKNELRGETTREFERVQTKVREELMNQCERVKTELREEITSQSERVKTVQAKCTRELEKLQTNIREELTNQSEIMKIVRAESTIELERVKTELHAEITRECERVQTKVEEELTKQNERVKNELRGESTLQSERVQTQLKKDLATQSERVKSELRKKITAESERVKVELQQENSKKFENITQEIKECRKEVSLEATKEGTKLMDKVEEMKMYQLGGSGNFYYFSNNTKNWTEAQTFCRSHGLELVAIETAQENTLIMDHKVKTYGNNDVWLGGTDEEHEGRWVWSGSQQDVVYADWYPREPSNRSGENCMATDGPSQWFDRECEKVYHFICET